VTNSTQGERGRALTKLFGKKGGGGKDVQQAGIGVEKKKKKQFAIIRRMFAKIEGGGGP